MLEDIIKQVIRILWIILCIIITYSAIYSLSGCSILRPGGGSTITTVPTATQQLWKAAKDSNWLVTVSILGIAAGAFAFLNGSKIGLPCIGASCISLFMALAVARFSTWMAVFGLIGSLAAVGISVLVKNRAMKEIVTGGEVFKKNITNTSTENRQRAEFCKFLFNADQQEAQKSKSTQKLVQNMKSKLKLRGQI